MDALTDILKTIRLTTETYFCSDFQSPWGMDIPKTQNGMFHIVVEGECWLHVENLQELLHLRTGDIVAFPTGGAHWMADDPNSPLLSGTEVKKGVQEGRNPFESKSELGKNLNTILCGSFNYDHQMSHPFLKDLPCFIHVNAKQCEGLKWLSAIIEVLSQEAKHPSSGSGVITDRLSEVLFVQLLRSHTQSREVPNGYMSALQDPQIGKALNLIHSEEKAQWSVTGLGEAVAMSRTSFNEKFTRLVGESPKQYLLAWRMQKASSELKNTNKTMFEIADTSGYASEAAFSKAFKQHYGVTPGKFRKNQS